MSIFIKLIAAFLLAISFSMPAMAFGIGDAVKLGGDMLEKKKQADEQQRQQAEQQKRTQLNATREYADRIIEEFDAIKRHKEIKLKQELLQAHSNLLFSYSNDDAGKIRSDAKALSDLLPPYQAHLRKIEKKNQAEWERKREQERLAAKKTEKERAEKRAVEKTRQNRERLEQDKQAKLGQEHKEREQANKKQMVVQAEPQHITSLSETDKLGEEILNYTTYGSKNPDQDPWKIIDRQNCVFKRKDRGLDNPEVVLKLNNVLVNSIKIGRLWVPQYKKRCAVISISGDKTVRQYLLNGKVVTNYESKVLDHSCNADPDRLLKAWKLLYEKVCTGATTSSF